MKINITIVNCGNNSYVLIICVKILNVFYIITSSVHRINVQNETIFADASLVPLVIRKLEVAVRLPLFGAGCIPSILQIIG